MLDFILLERTEKKSEFSVVGAVGVTKNPVSVVQMETGIQNRLLEVLDTVGEVVAVVGAVAGLEEDSVVVE